MTKTAVNRNLNLDLIRTLAIVLMVVFHFIYDLKHFGWLNTGIPDGEGWKQFRYVILSLFFICIGAGLVYSHAKKFHLKSFTFRLAKVAVGALFTTIMSLIMFPDNWIYFGVLQFIIVASVLAITFVRFPRTAFIIGVSIIALVPLGYLTKHWPFSYISHLLPSYTTDYVPLFPWLGVILLGISLAHCQWFNKSYITASKLTQQLSLPGKHSLIIYLVHQPLMFAILAPIHWLLN
jgi:uncharacterized membrane protein